MGLIDWLLALLYQTKLLNVCITRRQLFRDKTLHFYKSLTYQLWIFFESLFTSLVWSLKSWLWKYLLLQIHLFVCGLMLVTVFGYKLSCPDQLHRNIHEQKCTEEGTHYLCLFNVLDKENTELCVSRDFVVRPGI